MCVKAMSDMQKEIIQLLEARLIEDALEKQIEAEVERQRALKQQQKREQNEIAERALRERQNSLLANQTADNGANAPIV